MTRPTGIRPVTIFSQQVAQSSAGQVFSIMRAVAQRDLGAGPALDGGGDGAYVSPPSSVVYISSIFSANRLASLGVTSRGLRW